MDRLHERILHIWAAEAPNGDGSYPSKISPESFDTNLPRNPATTGPRPCLDIAPAGALGDHPPDAVVTGTQQPQLWYNPNRGIFRARVMPKLTER